MSEALSRLLGWLFVLSTSNLKGTYIARRSKSKSDYEFAGLPIYDIIRKPLLAIAKAQTAMAKEQIRSLLEICFTYDGHIYHPVMLEMTVTRSVLQPGKNPGDSPKVVEITTQFYVPVISIFSINSLGIENVDIDFNIEVMSQFEVDGEEMEDDAGGLEIPQQKSKKSIELLGKLSTKKIRNQEEGFSFSYDRAESSTFNINVEAGTLPLSKGLLEIIDIYTKAIHVTGMPEDDV